MKSSLNNQLVTVVRNQLKHLAGAAQPINISHCHRWMSPYLPIGWWQSTRWILANTDLWLINRCIPSLYDFLYYITASLALSIARYSMSLTLSLLTQMGLHCTQYRWNDVKWHTKSKNGIAIARKIGIIFINRFVRPGWVEKSPFSSPLWWIPSQWDYENLHRLWFWGTDTETWHLHQCLMFALCP